MSRQFLSTQVLCAFTLPPAVLADISGTATLSSGQNFNFDTGSMVGSGGDIQFTGSTITYQGSAKGGVIPGFTGSTYYSQITPAILQSLAALANSTPIPVNSLTAGMANGSIIGFATNGGHGAVLLVTAVSSSSLSFQYTTFEGGGGGTGGGGVPTITQILNNYGLVPAGFPNSGIAQGSLFIIKGSGLADPNAQATPLQDSSKGLPSTLNGASVKIVDASGATITPVFYYAIAAQLALVLPSNTAIGAAQVTVTYNNQASVPYSIQVVKSAMGFDAYYGTGSGLGVATSNATGALYDYTSSIPPGTTVVLWGSGLGADPARDKTYTPAAFSINNLAHVYLGGVDAPIVYQGASGYPGLNQVDITIPANAPTGCNVSLVGVNAAGVPTNFLTLPIGTGHCSDPAFGIADGSLFQQLSGQTTLKTGLVALSHSTSTVPSTASVQVTDAAIASFSSATGSSYLVANGIVSVPGCIVNQSVTSGGTTTSTGLDAGTITVTGPAGSATLMPVPLVTGSYLAQLASGFIPTAGGNFTIHGAGGASVGSFDTSVAFPNPLLSWTNQTAAQPVVRSAALPFTWTGGAPGTLVFMSGTSSGTVSGVTYAGTFTCIAKVEAGQFTVPSYVMSAMPGGAGSVTLSNYSNFNLFSAPGLDIGVAAGFVSSSITNVTYQ